jgi:hypothetical protein
MATYKVLGQTSPATANYTTALYTVPSGGSAIVSTITVANISASDDTFRLRVAVVDGAVNNKQYLFYNTPIAANTTLTLTLGLTVASTDVIYAGSTGGNCAFNAFGQEN